MRPDADKTTLRQAAIALRATLSDSQRAASAQAIAARAFPVAITPGLVISGYHPIRSEIDPIQLMIRLAAQGARLALPVIVARDAALLFRAWHPDDALVAGPFGIRAPALEAPELIPDIVLVPLAAFDAAGHRIGYGAGHYDRTLMALRTIKPVTAIGIAFAVQEIGQVPAEQHDVALDYVLTDLRTFDFPRL